jgi:Inositol polyphosphate kinase
VVYEGKDVESERLETNNYDADISNCSTDLNVSRDSQLQCSSNDENDGGIGHEDESNMDQCLYEDDEQRAPDSGNSEDIDEHPKTSKFLETPRGRAVSPHSMDSWLNYSNSSDEYSTQDLIVRKGTKLNLHDDETAQDTDDIDVYDKINFVNATSFKKSKIDGSSCHNDTATDASHGLNPFQFPPSKKTSEASASKHEIDDGIEVELEEEEDDDQLSSLSSNIDTIIVSDTGETKFFNSSGEQEEHPSVKKKKSTNGEEQKSQQLTNGSHIKPTPMALCDVRIIDFAHTTFSSLNQNEQSPNMPSKKIHHGPDGGFLTGIESLKRILSEIIVESI